MGNTSSINREEPDPWWQTNQTQQHTEQNVLQQARRPETDVGQDASSWQQRELSLGRTIQHLAEENMRLTIARQEAERKLEEVQRTQDEQEKQQQICEALRTQIQFGREERQMITAEMERLRDVFDKEREAKEHSMTEVDKLKRERDDNRRELKTLLERLEVERKTAEETSSAEKEAREQIQLENERLKKELKMVKMLLVSTKESQQSATAAGKEEMPAEASEFSSNASEMQLTEDKAAVIRSPETRAEMERFKTEMNIRREARQRAMHAVSSEMERLRSELNSERELRQQAEQKNEEYQARGNEDVSEQLRKARQELKSERKRQRILSTENERLQADIENGQQILAEKTDELASFQAQIESEREHSQQQVQALKEVAAICKQMLMIREGQVLQLKNKLDEIENNTTSERASADLRAEYRTQMENIRSLRCLYEERMNIIAEEKEKFIREAAEEVNKRLEAEKRLEEIQTTLSKQEEQLEDLKIRLDDSHDENLRLTKELALINNLFTQMLVGGPDTDLDKLTRLLEENHDLIAEITSKEGSSEVAATLPKLLLDLITQADNSTTKSDKSACSEGVKEEEECINGIAVQEIASNLPKVWKVLMELLSHHATPTENTMSDENESCYKRVDTPSGPRLVLSVSKTFLHLKDLILEKKSLQKELVRLKHLNGHLESKLHEQERRLSLVSTELHKTWEVVEQMQTQHQKLHTHEKILRYELQQKRKLLTELKQELEYCREKWERARQKNSESEVEWKKLRMEFASRKLKQPPDSLNNSGESGCFSDDAKEDIHAETPPLAAKNDILVNDEMTASHSELLGTSPDTEVLLLEEDEDLDPPTEDVNSFSSLQHQEQESSPSPDLSNVDNCSTVSMISLLKQQLAFFTRNLEYITSETSEDIPSNDLVALESIFALPPIQIPEYLAITRSGFLKGSCNDMQYYCGNDGAFDSVRATSSKCVSPTSTDLQSTSESHPDFSIVETSVVSQAEDLSLATGTKNINDPAYKLSSETNTSFNRLCSSDLQDKKTQGVEVIKPKTDERLANESPATAPRISNNTEVTHQASSSTEPSSQQESQISRRTPEEIAEARAARLNRLEEQCQQLYKKVTKTTHRSVALCNRLEELHEHYGSPPPSATGQEVNSIPVPPPLPQGKLRGRRLPITALPPVPESTTHTQNSEYPSTRLAQNSEDVHPERSPPPCSEGNGNSSVPVPPPLPSDGIRGRWIPTEISATRLPGCNGASSSSERSSNETTTRQNTSSSPSKVQQKNDKCNP